MSTNYKHDFSSASIKHQIEAEFYKLVGKSLPIRNRTATIVTGPDYQRHVDNYRKYICQDNLRICEINTDIFIEIYSGCKNQKKISVVNKSIENYGSMFIDCDLTCTSDLDVIKTTLLKQIDVQCQTATKNKAFIFSFGMRTHTPKCYEAYFRPILGLLGASVKSVNIMEDVITNGTNNWLKSVLISGKNGRICSYKCYFYNAGGGPMLTCLIIYK